MCSIAAAGLALAAVSTGLGAVGMVNQQAAMGAQAGYQAQVARRNQEIMEANAKQAEWQKRDAIDRGETEELKQRRRTDQVMGTQAAQLAAQGTDLAGSPTDILADTGRAGEYDALTIRNNAVREAWGYDTKAWNMRAGAANYGTEAAFRGSFQPSYLGAGASLLAGASSLADKWSRFQDAGAFRLSSPSDTMGSYNAMPASYTRPGMEIA